MGKRYPYKMGNAGDIIKHGLLAEFVEWWKDSNNKTLPLRVADTFGGRPWGKNNDITNKLRDSEYCALGRSYSEADGKYLGSSHLIRQTAEKCGMSVDIDISDKSEDARCNLKNSILGHENSMKMIKLPDGNNGYTILRDEQNPKQYDIILIDPYREFLESEFEDEGAPKYFTRIIELIENPSNLFVAVFALDTDTEKKDVHERFDNFKIDKLSHCAFSLRCPKQESDTYDFEILLISKQISDGKCDELRERLEHFASKVSEALFLQIEFWPEGQ